MSKIEKGGKYCMRGDAQKRPVEFLVGETYVYYLNPVSGDFEGVTLSGRVFDSSESIKDLIPIPADPVYGPYDDGDRDLVRDKWVKHKRSDHQWCIHQFSTGQAEGYTWRFLFDNYTHMDGTPFGKIVEEPK